MFIKKAIYAFSFLALVTPAVFAAGHGTPDTLPPANEDVCSGLSGAAYGLCNAYCEAQDCDVHARKSCEHLRTNFQKKTGTPIFPCDNAPCGVVTLPEGGGVACGGSCPQGQTCASIEGGTCGCEDLE